MFSGKWRYTKKDETHGCPVKEPIRLIEGNMESDISLTIVKIYMSKWNYNAQTFQTFFVSQIFYIASDISEMVLLWK